MTMDLSSVCRALSKQPPSESKGLRSFIERTTQSLASNERSAPLSIALWLSNVILQDRTMTRDVLLWLSLAGLFAAYCATLWVFFPLEG